MIDADACLTRSRRPLVIGIGGGGDVVGALATAETARLYAGASPVLGGVTWERQPIDPLPGPRATAEIEGAEELAPLVLYAGPETRIRASGVQFAESRMAGFLQERTVLVDVTGGPAGLADGIAAAADRLGCDLVVFVDVGGDVFSHGHEPGLGSPLCDAVMLAAAPRLERSGRPTLGAVFGPGCDGELTLTELAERLSDLGRAGGLAGARGITPAVAARLEAAIEHVVTEASAQAVRAFHGAFGPTAIRGGRRKLEVTPAGALTIYFDVAAAFESTAPLARAVFDASDLYAASAALNELGVETELDREIRAAAAAETAP